MLLFNKLFPFRFFCGSVIFKMLSILESHAVNVDPYDLLDAVDILSKIPKDFYENMVSC